jgi:hypothetical protein
MGAPHQLSVYLTAPFLLLQALRCDSAGRVEEYLVDAARHAPLFAHRLIWILGGGPALWISRDPFQTPVEYQGTVLK